MALVSSSMAVILWIGGSGLVVPSHAVPGAGPAPLDPPPGLPLTDPAHEPLQMGLGHEPDVQAAFNSPTLLFVNFDGPFMNGGCGNDSHADCSTIFPNVQFEPFPGTDATKAAVVQATREDVVDFGVIVVGERPPMDNPYAMVVVGLPVGGLPGGIGGVAPGIDCGNTDPNLTSFSFLVNSGPNVQATVIHQEAAHTWGLEHVDDDTDNLFPTTGGVTDPKYQDTCSQVVANVDLDPIGASCNAVHTMFCPANQQNSYQEMLLLFGPPIPDTAAPSVVIVSPTEGQVLDYAEDFDLTVTLDDDRRPQVLSTQVYFDDVQAADTSLINSTLTFPVNGGDPPAGHGLSDGPHTIRVDITDEAGNPASAEVTVEITNSPFGMADADTGIDASGSTTGDSGDEPPEGTAGTSDPTITPSQDDDDEGCACRAATRPGAGAGLLVLLVMGLLRRRR
jgi:hypothetical protein